MMVLQMERVSSGAEVVEGGGRGAAKGAELLKRLTKDEVSHTSLPLFKTAPDCL